jgi:hypothetical protein
VLWLTGIRSARWVKGDTATPYDALPYDALRYCDGNICGAVAVTVDEAVDLGSFEPK